MWKLIVYTINHNNLNNIYKFTYWKERERERENKKEIIMIFVKLYIHR